MRYLSFDLEATGLNENDLIIEFAMIPFCTQDGLNYELAEHMFIQCPSFKQLRPKLDPWVVKNNEQLINKAHKEGISLTTFKSKMTEYLEDEVVKDYFKDSPKGKVILFGKSLNAIDLPFLNRDLGWDFMRKYFHHQVLDLSSIVMSDIDRGFLPSACISGSELMNHFQMGDVAHTALEDAINTAKLYLKVINTEVSLSGQKFLQGEK